MIARLLLVLLALSWLAPAAAEVPAPLEPGGRQPVGEIVDGDTLVLADGRRVRLVGLQAPKLPLGRADFPDWPLAEEAKDALAGLTLGHELELGYGGRQTDRHGRQLAHLYREDGLWVQGEMLRLGLARVYSFADNRALVPEMLAIEREARAKGRGIWADPYYRVLAPEETGAAIDTFQLVEGVALDAAVVSGRGFLNFGPDRLTDFTLTIDPESRRRFAAAGIAIEDYSGHRVRARGWLQSYHGPMIEVTHPEQIEVLP